MPSDAPHPLRNCRVCPRQCGIDRFSSPGGFCAADAGFAIASVTLHRGEEPAISGSDGICNVFFGRCNLRCRYCQNQQISRPESRLAHGGMSLAEVTGAIAAVLDRGVDRVGFVSPSHMVPQMIAIIRELHRRGRRPVIVYNSNGYDRVDCLRELENLVDVYLPDCKYMDPRLAQAWSGAGDYPQVAAAALREMYRQRGNIVHLDSRGMATRGLIVRHLVLPGAVDNSLAVLRFLAGELSSRITLSLMSQYRPIAALAQHVPLGRRLLAEEYEQVTAAMERLGFVSGWVQELASADAYCPDFDRPSPFDE